MFRSNRFLAFLASLSAFILGACDKQVVPGSDADIIITNVSIIDVESGSLKTDRHVFIKDGVIAEIKLAESEDISQEKHAINGRGKFLIPGLTDMHAHVSKPEQLIPYLAAGVTTIRNLWGEQSSLTLREDIVAGRILGPRMTTSGRIIDGAQPAFDAMHSEVNPESVKAVVKAQAEAGYDFVKIYSNMSLEVFDAVMAASKKYGIEVSGHIPTLVPIEHAIKSGMKTTEHILGLSGVFLGSNEISGLDLYIFYPDVREFLAAVGRGEIDLNNYINKQKIDDFVQLTSEHETWFVPTITALRNFSTKPSSKESIQQKWHRVIPPSLRASWEASWKHRAASWPQDTRRGEDLVQAIRLETLLAVHKAGGRILIGTDAPVPGMYWGGAVLGEMLALHDIGISNTAVLYAGTKEAARYLGKEGLSGEVIVGAEADLVLLNENPLKDLNALAEIAGVVRGGKWLSSTQLDKMMNDLANSYDAQVKLFADAPEAPKGFGTFADFISESGKAIRVTSKNNDDELHVLYATKSEGSANWVEASIEIRSDQITYKKSGSTVLQIQGDNASQKWIYDYNHFQQDSTAADFALMLTDSPADVLVMEYLDNIIDVSKANKIKVSVMQCDLSFTCSDGTLINYDFSDLGKEMIADRTFFALSRHYQLSLSDKNIAQQRDYWVSAGGATGRALKASGDPLKFEMDAGSEKWTRIR